MNVEMLKNDPGCETIIENNISKIVPSHYYPIYLDEAVHILRYPAYPKRGILIQSNLEVNPFPKYIDSHLLENGSSLEELVKILLAADYRLTDVISLQKSELTKAFLVEKKLTSKDDYYERCQRVDPYSLIDNDARDSVNRVMHLLDVKNAEVILTYGPDSESRRRHFFYNLVSRATKHQNLNMLNVFVKQIIKWNILDEEGSRLIELDVFHKSSKEVLRIFLQHRLDFYIEKMFGNNVLAALFGNPQVKIGALKRKKRFNVNATGHKGFTALHYAMVNKNVKKVKFLLDRGAKPNAMTTEYLLTSLHLALWEPTANPTDNEKCAELLLQYGANPFYINIGEGIGFFRCMYARRSLEGSSWPVYAPAGYLTKLALAYACMYDAAGLRGDPPYLEIYLRRVTETVNKYSDLLNYYRKCQQELQTLKEHKIRRYLTMFTIASKTGEHLIRLVNKEDQKIITSYIRKYAVDAMINSYYINAMREHMRQFRKLVAHKNRAIFVISENAKTLAPYSVVLNKIISYLTYEDLLTFQ